MNYMGNNDRLSKKTGTSEKWKLEIQISNRYKHVAGLPCQKKHAVRNIFRFIIGFYKVM